MRTNAPFVAPLVALIAALLCGTAAVPATAADDDGPHVAFSLKDDRITESSGLAASRQHKGVYWTHNDSDDGPYVYAVDSRGRTVATVTLRGIDPRDVEAIAVGPNGQIYVGDIGDNDGVTWPEVWIYRFTEPKQLQDTTVDVTRYTVRYADGSRDAEALLVDPKTGRAYIADKNENGGAIYRGPERLSATGINVFRRTASEVPWVTDGALSPDGSRLVLRGYFWAAEYRWNNGSPKKIGRVEFPLQQQGESVTFTADGRALMYGSEGEGSEVWRVPLSDDRLPDSVPKATPGTDGGASQGGSDGGGASTGSTRNITVGFVVFAVALAGALGMRRLVKR